MSEDNGTQPTNSNGNNGRDSWVLWQKIVLSDIERNSKDIEDLYKINKNDDKSFNDFKIEYTEAITKLKTEAKIWAAAASIISSAVALAVAELIFHYSK